MSKYFNFNTEEREKVDSEVVAERWKEDFGKLKKEERKEPANVVQFLANFVVVDIDTEFEDELKTNKIKLDLFVPKQISSNDDARRRDNEKEDAERAFNPLKRKRIYGTAVTVPKQLTADIKLYQKPYDILESNVYRPAKECHDLQIPYIPGGYTPEYVTCADIAPEVQPGDKVYFHYLTVSETNQVIGEDGRIYYKLRYNNIFCVVRAGKIIPIGGYILLNEIFDEDVEELPEIKTAINFAPAITAKRTKSGIIREVHVKPKALEGIVKHVGTPLYCDQCEIAPGDVVAFELNANMIVNIEGKDYYVIPYRDILAKSTK